MFSYFDMIILIKKKHLNHRLLYKIFVIAMLLFLNLIKYLNPDIHLILILMNAKSILIIVINLVVFIIFIQIFVTLFLKNTF